MTPNRTPWSSPPASPKRYLLARLYAAIGMLVFYGCWAGSMYGSLLQDGRYALLMIPGVVFGAPAIVLMVNWFTFPWPYSVFGRLRRRPSPPQEPVRLVPLSWARIGYSNVGFPMVTWSFFPEGLGIDVLLIGRVYLPADFIVAVEETWPASYVIHHNCPELRSPIFMPAGVYSALVSSVDERFRGRLIAVKR